MPGDGFSARIFNGHFDVGVWVFPENPGEGAFQIETFAAVKFHAESVMRQYGSGRRQQNKRNSAQTKAAHHSGQTESHLNRLPDECFSYAFSLKSGVVYTEN